MEKHVARQRRQFDRADMNSKREVKPARRSCMTANVEQP
jgi:hypothetical protein